MSEIDSDGFVSLILGSCACHQTFFKGYEIILRVNVLAKNAEIHAEWCKEIRSELPILCRNLENSSWQCLTSLDEKSYQCDAELEENYPSSDSFFIGVKLSQDHSMFREEPLSSIVCLWLGDKVTRVMQETPEKDLRVQLYDMRKKR